MTEIDLSTEQRILKAAKTVFIKKGLEGARMQEIADEAEINKALLHYYFRSKDKLFEGVFKEAFFQVIPDTMLLLKKDLPLFDKIRIFADRYIDIFIDNPFIPGFVMHELQRDPDRIIGLIEDIGVQPEIFAGQIQAEVEKGTIRPVDPRQLIVNLLALCIFPFVASPILKTIIFRKDMEAFQDFIRDRKKAVPEFIIQSIKKNG
jgi:AcrR family transcriptional regulator